ncbi:hypothetical protein K438DRAFT_1933357 [Mycena galopus ATCC 62051]|nr:hypothetical protein K438DRAFT_1933357 [Mycena galopus ATCC 62051]
MSDLLQSSLLFGAQRPCLGFLANAATRLNSKDQEKPKGTRGVRRPNRRRASIARTKRTERRRRYGRIAEEAAVESPRHIREIQRAAAADARRRELPTGILIRPSPSQQLAATVRAAGKDYDLELGWGSTGAASALSTTVFHCGPRRLHPSTLSRTRQSTLSTRLRKRTEPLQTAATYARRARMPLCPFPAFEFLPILSEIWAKSSRVKSHCGSFGLSACGQLRA